MLCVTGSTLLHYHWTQHRGPSALPVWTDPCSVSASFRLWWCQSCEELSVPPKPLCHLHCTQAPYPKAPGSDNAETTDPTVLPLRPSWPMWTPPLPKNKSNSKRPDNLEDTCRSRVEVGLKRKVFKKSLGQLSSRASGTFESRWAVIACKRLFLIECRQRAGSKGVSKSLM